MEKDKLALFMTVGTGYGEDGHIKLAKGLIKSIEDKRPDYIVFFCSKDSIKTIEAIKDLTVNSRFELIDNKNYENVLLNNIDDFKDCFNTYETKFIDLKDDYEFVVDFTSGTKVMSVSIATFAMFYNIDFNVVAGDRKDGTVSEGTELINKPNIYFLYDKILMNNIKNLFNNNRFYSAIQLLHNVVDPNLDKNEFINLFNAYYFWDNVNFEKAFSYLSNLNLNYGYFNSLSNNLKLNINALAKICKSPSEKLKNCYVLASLINNAKRRAEEHKYDDAIARLYRSFELIGQISLNEYGLKSSNIDINILEKHSVSLNFINSLKQNSMDGIIKIGLIKDFNLLYELDNPIGIYFKENEKKILNLTKKRNDSILAHGLESQSKEDYENFEGIVVNFAKKIDKDMDKFLNETKFAKFNSN